MISLALAAIAFIFLSYIDNQNIAKTLPRFLYLSIMFPGIVLHESSHAIFAVLTGAKISNIRFFSASGGQVTHSEPRVPVIGQFLISFAPLAIGILIILLLYRTLHISFQGQINIPFSDWHITKPIFANHFHWWYIIVIYLILSISLTLMPSRQDITASIAGILAIGLVLYIFFINDWLKIPDTIAINIWYINIILGIILVGAFPLKLIFKKR